MIRTAALLVLSATVLFGASAHAEAWRALDAQRAEVTEQLDSARGRVSALRERYERELAEVDRLKEALLRAVPLTSELPRALQRAHATALELAAEDARARRAQRELDTIEERLERALHAELRALRARPDADPGRVAELERRAADARPVRARYEPPPVEILLADLDETSDELLAAADELEDLARRMERELADVQQRRQRESNRARLVGRARGADRERALFDDGGVRRFAASRGASDEATAGGSVGSAGGDASPSRGGTDGAVSTPDAPRESVGAPEVDGAPSFPGDFVSEGAVDAPSVEGPTNEVPTVDSPLPEAPAVEAPQFESGLRSADPTLLGTFGDDRPGVDRRRGGARELERWERDLRERIEEARRHRASLLEEAERLRATGR